MQTLKVAEEKKEVRIHPVSTAQSFIAISMKDGHIELGYPGTAVDNCSNIYNCWAQRPIFLPGCPV